MLLSKATQAAVGLSALAGVALAEVAISNFDWSAVAPSTSLNYTTCYTDFKCARLLLPLDYLNSSNPSQVTLAIIALPAVVPESDASFGGTIFTNPGGPGGSGVGFLLQGGRALQRMTDSDEKKFEILSFDPRGMGQSLPRSDCWNDEVARTVFNTEELAMGPPDEGLHAIGRNFARSRGFGELCERAGGGGDDDIRNFSSTSSVARDMVEIVDRIDELRNPSKKKDGGDEDGDEDEEESQLELRSSKDLPRLNYLGYSYGTALGNYFASMFPGRVGHVALEAVVDIHDYHNGTWARNLQDMPYTYEHFWETCFAAKSKCALYQSTDSGPKDVSTRFSAWISELEASPGTYLTSTGLHAVTPYHVAVAMFSPMYNPMRLFPRTASVLAEAMRGNYTGLFDMLPVTGFGAECPLKTPTSYTWDRDAMSSVACGDALPQTGVTIPEFQDYIGELKSQDPAIGPYWSSIRGSCTGWRYRPKYAFSGPWTTPEHDPSGAPGRPLSPILFISSKYDPVTPLRNAREMMKYHPGSGLLIQDNVGHSTGSTPGKCRDDVVRRFFAKGEVPKGEVYCKADCRPFEECSGGGSLSTYTVGNSPLYHRSPLQIVL